MDSRLLQIATAFSLQIATGTEKVRWTYYKLRQLLQSATIIPNCDSTISMTHFDFFLALAPDAKAP